MCFYTYHHYSACGHIANWTVNSCKEYTNTLRVLSREGLSGHCDKIQTTHNLVLKLVSDTCGQCDFELSSHRVHDASMSTKHRTIEGLNSKAPIFELSGHMNTNFSGKDERNDHPSTYQDCCDCDDYNCSEFMDSSDEETDSFGVGPNETTSPTNTVADVLQCPDNSFFWPETPTHTGKQFDIMPQVLPSEEEIIADLCKALRRQTSAEDISPSSTQVDVRRSCNSLHGVIPIGIYECAHPLERLDTRNLYATSFLNLSDDESPIEFELAYAGNELEQAMFDLSDDSFYFDYESEVRSPNDLNFLDDDSDTDDDSDGGCDLPDESDDEFAEMFSPLISNLVSNSVDVSLPSLRDSAPEVDRPATPMLCLAPPRMVKPPQFLSLDFIVEDIFDEEVFEKEALEILHNKAYVTLGRPLCDDHWEGYGLTEPRPW
ncbi:uncharacterized protein N7496_006659 [Penicillium cataractarum]|uniref:Uncharacterized protein n=1 Tax=Penicillium cataractarum TaxID=2100454 RepID=A0A9W9S1X7_9EURO|nr:uncharacterized protein N7496_006659 [Penicillium cataractarum]KAJ5370567.1 hypothetical protein N7496_006659 [Penicillium cataractarum]